MKVSYILTINVLKVNIKQLIWNDFELYDFKVVLLILYSPIFIFKTIVSRTVHCKTSDLMIKFLVQTVAMMKNF